MKTPIKYPAISPCQLNGDHPIIDSNGNQIADLSDYWSWAHSDLLGNTERGIFAEFLVRIALKIKDNRDSWSKYDLLYRDKIRIEVKSSAYIQTWGQKELSSVKFSISPSYGWNSEDNSYEIVRKRQSDIYVFCLLNCKEQANICPTDVRQWQFYILPTKILNINHPVSKTISLSSLKKLSVTECGFDELKHTVDALIDENKL